MLLSLLMLSPSPAVIILSLADVFTAVSVAGNRAVAGVPDAVDVLMILASLELLMLPASLLGTGFAAAAKVPNVDRSTNATSVVATVSVCDVSFVFPAAVTMRL